MSAAAPQTFEDKGALVTGAGRGIGRAISLGFAAGGARVAFLGRPPDELDEVARAVHDLGGIEQLVRRDFAPCARTSSVRDILVGSTTARAVNYRDMTALLPSPNCVHAPTTPLQISGFRGSATSGLLKNPQLR